MNGMRRTYLVVIVMACFLACGWAGVREPNEPTSLSLQSQTKVAIISCKGMIDDGLFESIERRCEEAIGAGAGYLVLEIETYGGLVASADSIAKYLILTVGDRAKTVAYVNTEAISAGAMISVSCNDIIMKEDTTIGDCAPITMGGKLEGVEREKQESFVRATFQRAAEANGYPELLLKAMVSMQIVVWRVKHMETGRWDFYEPQDMPKDANEYDVDGAEKVVGGDEILTLTASQALEYGVARAVVEDLDGALAFLENRDGIQFVEPPIVLDTLWSEEMVRWLNSPMVMGVLIMLAMLGAYVEFGSPGLGLPGLVAVICLAIIVGSKYLTGLANWIEVLMLLAGIVLLFIEFLVLPGFGIAGISGVVLLLAGLFGMLLQNGPDEIPWPRRPEDWKTLTDGVLGIVIGLVGFSIFAGVLTRYLPRLKFMSGLILVPNSATPGRATAALSMTGPSVETGIGIRIGDMGQTLTKLRPAGKARFGEAVVDVVAVAEFLDAGTKIVVAEIHGNRVVVKKVENT